MACGCGGQTQQDMWEVVYGDKTVSQPMSKPEATQEAHTNGGYIREAGPVPAGASR